MVELTLTLHLQSLDLRTAACDHTLLLQKGGLFLTGKAHFTDVQTQAQDSPARSRGLVGCLGGALALPPDLA